MTMPFQVPIRGRKRSSKAGKTGVVAVSGSH